MASSLAMIDKNMNIDDFVDECFQFAVDYQGGKPDGSKKPKGTIRKHQRLVNLKSQLLQSRQQVMKNVLNARALEKSLLQVEMTETVMKKRVMATEEMNRMSATKQALVALQCGKPLAFSDASLEFIEEAAMLPRGVGAALQKGLNCWSDTDIDAGLKNTPFSKSQASLVIDRSLFQRVVIAASGAYLSEIDAGLLYDKGEALYDMLLRRTSQQVSITKWDLLCTMLKKQLLICHLARTLSTGENLLAQQPAFLLKSKSTKLISSSELISDTSRGRASMTGIHSATSTRRPNSNSKQMLSSSLESTYQIKDVKKLRKNNKIVGGKNVPKKNFSKSLTLSRLSSTESVYDDLMNEFSQSLIDKNAISNSMATQMAWVTQEINLGKDFTSARNFAKHIGVRKMEKVIWSKVKRKQGEVLAKWKSVTIYCENKDKCVSFLKTMSTYRISNALQSGIENKLKRGELL